MAVTKQQVAELYVATFNRAPDAAGLDYWVNTSGLTIENIAKSFFDQAETQTLYPEGTTDTAFVTSVYTNLFNRAPDAAGLAYWVADLAAGTSRSVMIEAMKNGAQGTDATIIANKATVALAYAASGLEGSDFSLASVTADSTTVSAALGNVSDLSNPGSSFALTSGIVNGTAGVDTISATNATYAATTILDGKAGVDTLTVTTTDDVVGTPTVIGVENVNFTLAGFTTAGTAGTFEIDANNVTATNFTIDLNQVGSSINDAEITNVVTGSTVNFSTDFSDINHVLTDADANVTVVANGTNVDVDSAGAVNNVTITSNAVAATAIDTDADSSVIVTSKATGTTGTTLTAAAATSINATVDGKLVLATAAATTVVATAVGQIDATTAALTAATSVNLTSKDDVDVKVTNATAITLAAGTTTAAAVSAITDTGVKLVTVNVSGNESAAEFNITAATKVNTVNISGSQAVTITADIDTVTALTGSKITIVDSSTAASTLNLIVATASADLTAAAVDTIKLAADNSGVLTFASAASVLVAADQTSADFDGVDASAASNTLSIVLNDGTAAAGAVDFTTLTLTDFASVAIDASVDGNASTITALNGSSDNTDVTVAAGTNGVTFATSMNLGTGDLTVTGSGAVSFGTTVVTATTVNASAVAGAVDIDIDASKVETVSTGSAADDIALGVTGDVTINSNGGNDTVSIAAITTVAADDIIINAGEGTDTLAIANGADLDTFTTLTLSGFEILQVTTAATFAATTINDFTGTVVKGSGGADAITVTVAASTTSVDLSDLVIDSSTFTGTDGFIVNATPATAAVTLTGSSVADTLTGSAQADTISGGAGADILVGAAGADTITGGAGADTITGGAGADTIVLTETTSAVDTVKMALADGSAVGVAAGTFTGFDTITGFITGTDVVSVDITDFDGSEEDALSSAATNALNDLTVSNYTSVDQVVNYFNDLIASGAYTPNANATMDVFAVKFGTTMTVLYSVADTDAVITADEITILGTVDAVLAAAGDLVIA
ncbi:MAG: DUF4214 domain-containing protein [Sulfurospirillaceae bacterium]|nr:DUF4214 domain-containing protein [Sulfurospirillaceae bacterium]